MLPTCMHPPAPSPDYPHTKKNARHVHKADQTMDYPAARPTLGRGVEAKHTHTISCATHILACAHSHPPCTQSRMYEHTPIRVPCASTWPCKRNHLSEHPQHANLSSVCMHTHTHTHTHTHRHMHNICTHGCIIRHAHAHAHTLSHNTGRCPPVL